MYEFILIFIKTIINWLENFYKSESGLSKDDDSFDNSETYNHSYYDPDSQTNAESVYYFIEVFQDDYINGWRLAWSLYRCGRFDDVFTNDKIPPAVSAILRGSYDSNNPDYYASLKHIGQNVYLFYLFLFRN